MVVYFSAFTYTVYYLGWIQVVIKKIAWLLVVTMGTAPHVLLQVHLLDGPVA